MDLKLLNTRLLEDLENIHMSDFNIVKRTDLSIVLCRNILAEFKKEVVKKGFSAIESEVDFFKNTKQGPLTNLVFHSELRSFEIRFPKGDMESQKMFIEKKIGKLNRFFVYNMDFVQYVEQERTYLDEQYFTRTYFDKLNITHSKYYFRDPEYSTSHDLLLAKLKANKRLINYLENRLKDLGNRNGIINGNSYKTLKWTASKVALTELIYALYHNRTINNGETSLKDIATTFKKVLNFELGDFYKTYTEIRMRKKSRTKFLDDLSMGLLFKMEDEDN